MMLGELDGAVVNRLPDLVHRDFTGECVTWYRVEDGGYRAWLVRVDDGHVILWSEEWD